MAVIEALTSDDDDRVAQVLPGGAKCRQSLVVGVEQEHHFILEIADAALAGLVHRRQRPERVDVGRLGQRVARDHVTQGVEPQHEAGAAGVHHTGLFQYRELLGRLGERHARGVARSVHHGLERRGILSALGGGARYRKNCPFDGARDRLAGEHVGAHQTRG